MNLNKNILCLIAAILAILFLTVMDSRGQFGFNNVAVVGSFTANVASTGGGSCQGTAGQSWTSASGADNSGDVAGNEISGVWFTNVSAVTICRVDYKLTKKVGSITGKTYNVKFYSYSGGTSLGTLLGTSDNVTGSDAWNATQVTFTFTTKPNLSANTRYAVVVTTGAYDASNYAGVHYTSNSGTEYNTWRNDLTVSQQNVSYALDCALFYYQ